MPSRMHRAWVRDVVVPARWFELPVRMGFMKYVKPEMVWYKCPLCGVAVNIPGVWDLEVWSEELSLDVHLKSCRLRTR